MTTTPWYYSDGASRRGPVSQDELESAVVRGEIDRQSLVWRQGMPEWQALEDVEELQPLLEQVTPPPLPDQPPPLPDQPPPVPAASAGPMGPGAGRPYTEDGTSGPTDGRSRWKPAVLAVAVLLAGVAIYYWICCWPRPTEPPAGPALGEIEIDANPWGRVQWIRGPDGEIDLPDTPTTPLVLSVPAGDYVAEVEYPPGQASQRCELRVQPGQLEDCWLDLAPVDAAAYFQRIGW